MDCEAETERMVDLLYEELSDADAAATRAHIEACASCAAVFGRLSSGHELASLLPLEEPPATVRASVLRAARDKAAGRASVRGAAEERTAPPRHDHGEDEARGLWASFLRWIGSLAMRPQLAMAMTLLLMVGIGLWYLDMGRTHDPAAHVILNPAPGEEVGPSATLEPAEPLERGLLLPRDSDTDEALQVDGRADDSPRPQGSDGREEQATAPPTGTSRASNARRSVAATPTVSRGRPDDRVLSGASDDVVAGAEERASNSAPIEVPRPESAPRDVAPAAAAPAAEEGSRRAAPAYATAPAAGSGAPGSVPGSVATESVAPPAPARAVVDGVPGPEADARQLLAAALHQRAGTQRSSGNCQEALRTYQRLLSAYPTYERRPEVMIDAADCQRRLGQLAAARRLLEQASRTPRVASRARRELAELAALERAHERGARDVTTASEPAP